MPKEIDPLFGWLKENNRRIAITVCSQNGSVVQLIDALQSAYTTGDWKIVIETTEKNDLSNQSSS